MDKVLEEVKKFVKQPVTTLMEKEQNEDYKVSGIKGLVSAAVIALISVLTVVAGLEAGLKGASSQIRDAAYQAVNLFGTFFQVLAISVCLILAIAGVFFAVAKLMKVEKSFKNSLALASNYAIYLAVTLVVYYLLQFINSYVAAGAAIFVGSFSSYAIKYAFKNSLGAVDDDKLVLMASIVVTVVTVIGAIILYNMFLSQLASSITGASRNSMYYSLY